MVIFRDDGISLLEDIRMPGEGHMVLTGWSQPVAAFLPGGLLALADDERLAVLKVSDGKLVMETKLLNHPASSHLLGICPAGLGRISLLRDGGEAEMWAW